MTKLICFDFDGTLIDSWSPFETLAVRYTQENNLPEVCLKSLREGYGYPDEYDFWKDMEKEEQRRHLYTLFTISEDPYHEMMGGAMPRAFDGVPETLEQLKSQDYTLAIVTARPETGLHQILEHYEISAHFCGFRSHDDVKRRGEKTKPHPDQLLSVIKELGYTPDQTVMVGDTCMDMKMARAAGTRAIGVTWGNHCIKRLSEGGAHHVLEEKFEDLAYIIKNWAQEKAA